MDTGIARHFILCINATTVRLAVDAVVHHETVGDEDCSQEDDGRGDDGCCGLFGHGSSSFICGFPIALSLRRQRPEKVLL